MARNTRKYPKKDDEDFKETIQKLRSQVRNLRKKVKDLQVERDSLLDAWAKTEAYLADITEDIPLEDIIKYKKLPKKATMKKDKKRKKIEETDSKKEDTRKKFQNWAKENL